ncbi:MAG: aminodeoxychorismate lyase [Flavobacteriaceae bacterium]|nr:aminodeoxychorismate lyase [Flavobacteriaceae bacterium]
MKTIFRIFIIISFLIIASIAIFGYKVFFKSNTSFNQDFVYVYVNTGSNADDMISSISSHIIDIESFIKAAKTKKYLENIKAGRFIIHKGDGNNKIINSLRSKNIPLNITFNNIQTIQEFSGYISKKIEADSTSLIESFTDENFLKSLNLSKESVLSVFLPNTYEFFWNTSADNFREKMVNEFDNFWNENRVDKAKKIGLNAVEVSVLASIVQKETPKVDERPTIAGVYLNRLNRRMKLQADPTIVYVIKRKEGFDKKIRRVLYKDLRIKSPYNTYLNKGLPPGPIVTPDFSAIEAVLNPSSHNFIFFVADVSNPGYHLFSRTLVEHNRKKRQYTKWLKENRIKR